MDTDLARLIAACPAYTTAAAAAAPLLTAPAAVVLFKGSRGMALERVLERLCGADPDPARHDR